MTYKTSGLIHPTQEHTSDPAKLQRVLLPMFNALNSVQKHLANASTASTAAAPAASTAAAATAGTSGISSNYLQKLASAIQSAANVGTAGIGLFLQKADAVLQFKNIKAADAKLTVTDSTGDKTIAIGFGSVKFTDLSDTPAYSGNANRALAVNATENGVAVSLTLAALATGFTIAGGTTSKTLTVPLDASVSGTNTGDVTLGTANGLSLSGQALSMAGSTTSAVGAVQLSNSYAGTSQTLATTEKALADGLATKGSGTVTWPELIKAMSYAHY